MLIKAEHLTLKKALAKANVELDHEPKGILSLRARKSIWLAMIPLRNEVESYRCRIELESLCVRHVLSEWYRAFPQDDGPERMLDLAHRVAFHEVADQLAQRERDSFYVDVVENRKYSGHFSSMLAAHAAANTVMSALIRNNHDAIPSVDDDEALDAESFDPSYLCASAAAGGFNDDKSANYRKRRAFWSWYLDEAIPKMNSDF